MIINITFWKIKRNCKFFSLYCLILSIIAYQICTKFPPIFICLELGLACKRCIGISYGQMTILQSAYGVICVNNLN